MMKTTICNFERNSGGRKGRRKKENIQTGCCEKKRKMAPLVRYTVPMLK